MILLNVKSFADVPSSATVNILVAPKATGHEIVAPLVPPVLSVTVTLPPRVNVDAPEIVPPELAQPPSRETALAVIACPKENVLAEFTFKEAIVRVRPVVVVPPEMMRLLKAENIEEFGNVLLAVNSTVPVPRVKVELVKRGYVFQSDTDTEVLVNLIEEIQIKENLKLGKAVQVALNQVVGAYAIAVFDKNDKRTIYNMIYRDGKNGSTFIKRFNVSGVTRDKFYDLTQEKAGSQVLYFSHNPNGEAEVITVLLRQVGSIKKLKWDLDFADIAIKGRASRGNTVTKYPIKKIELKEKGISTLRPRKVWFDDTVQRLNVDGRGELLGEFRPNDRLLLINQSGKLKTIIPELTTHFDEDIVVMEKWNPNKPISAIYFDGDKERYFIKRFLVENENKEEIFITEHEKSQLEIVSTDWRPMAEIIYAKVKGVQKDNQTINLEEFIAVKGIKALGNQLTTDKLKQVNLLEPLPYEEPEPEQSEEIEGTEETDMSDDIQTETGDDGQITLSLE